MNERDKLLERIFELSSSWAYSEASTRLREIDRLVRLALNRPGIEWRCEGCGHGDKVQ